MKLNYLAEEMHTTVINANPKKSVKKNVSFKSLNEIKIPCLPKRVRTLQGTDIKMIEKSVSAITLSHFRVKDDSST